MLANLVVAFAAVLGSRIAGKMVTLSLIIPGPREYSHAKVICWETDFVSCDVMGIVLLKLMCCFVNNQNMFLAMVMHSMVKYQCY